MGKQIASNPTPSSSCPFISRTLTFYFVENKNVKLFLKMLKQDFASIFRNKSQKTCTVSAFLCQFYCICTDIIKHSIWQNLNVSNS